MRLALLKEIPEDDGLRRQWNALVCRADRPQVFYTHEWSLAVQRAYGKILKPLLFLGYEGETLFGVAAMALDAPSRRVSFLCANTGDYCDFICQNENKAPFVAAILSELRRMGVSGLALANLPADSNTLSVLQQTASSSGYHCFARTAYICAQVSFDRVEKDKQGKPYAPGLKRLRRFEKAMGPNAPVHTEHRRTWDSIEAVLPELIRAHVARFLEVGRLSNLAENRRQLFLVELAKLVSQRQWLVLSRMLAGDRPVAWHYGFQFHDSWFWYQPTFDSVVEKHWPGFCLLSQVIQDALECPDLKMLDLGLGSEAYKSKFANDTRETLYVTLDRSIAAHWREKGRFKVAERIKSSPALNKAALNLRQRTRLLQERVRDRGLAATLSAIASRASRLISSRDQVVFFEPGINLPLAAHSDGFELCKLELGHLADGVMKYRDDEETCSYLLRAAARLRLPGMEGYVLRDVAGQPLHFAWMTVLDGFACAELNTALHSAAQASLLFDCWTPAAIRGNGHYSRTISMIAARMQSLGKALFIFSAASNTASIKGIEGAGFKRSYSLTSYRLLGRQRIKRAEVAARGTLIKNEAEA